jgi:hypothetical protein
MARRSRAHAVAPGRAPVRGRARQDVGPALARVVGQRARRRRAVHRGAGQPAARCARDPRRDRGRDAAPVVR